METIFLVNCPVKIKLSMKKGGIVVLMVLLSNLLFAQFSDDFTDGDFTANPVWGGTTSKFIIDGANELQSSGNSGASDELYLSTPSQSILGAEWTFDINLTFNPTTSNYTKIFLVSDQSDLTGNLNGYYIRIGETGGSDTFELFRQDGGSDTKLLIGNVPFASSVNGKIRVTRDSSGVWELLTDEGNSGSFTSNGTVLDSTYKSTSFFGIYCKYSTASRFDMFHFDNFNVTGGFFVDNTPPSIQSVLPVSSNQLDVVFNENVDQATAEIIGNYSVNGGIGTPTIATLDGDGKTVHLTFANTFVNGNSYTITAISIDDLSGNTLTSANQNFTYFIPSYRDVVITEIHADPDAATTVPAVEFIELYNSASADIDLTGFEFSDPSSTATLGSFVLGSNEYVTICKSGDTSLFTSFGNVLGVSSFPTLNNSGDDLTLHNGNGNLIDEVNYSSSWYNGASTDGISLEIINPNHPCSLSSNWWPSQDASGGTPSQQNSVFDTTPDTQAPEILSYNLLADTSISIEFSEPIDPSGITLTDFTVSANSLFGFSVKEGNTVLEIRFGTIIQPNLLHQLQISNIKDCIGNVMSTETIEFGLGIDPEEFVILIDEIFADESPQVGLPIGEFVELFNNSSDIVSLDGCFFTDFNDTMYLNNVNMLPNSYLILSGNYDYLEYGPAYINSSMPGINNTGETIALLSKTGGVIHSVKYTDDWYNDDDKDGGGWTLEMIDPDNYCGEETNWTVSVNSNGGTPGEINSVDASNPDLTAPELDRAVAVNPNLVYVYFNEKMDESTLVKENFSINNSQEILNVYSLQDEKTFEIFLTTTLELNTVYTVTVTGVTDCIGNNIGAENMAEFALPEDPEIGDIIINEILFNPLTGGKDFVELYNNSNKYIDIKNISLLDFDEDTIKDIKNIIEDFYVLPPQQYVWLTEGIEEVTGPYPRAIEDNAIETDLPTYSNAEGTVAIGFYEGDTLIVADRFDYEDDFHYELLDDDDGVSLERLVFDGETNDRNNWHSASATEGYATPGYQNSQQLNIEGIEDQVTIFPEVFTPDEDGDKDYTTINYSFDDAGYTLNITIFDSYGRLITNLVQNDIVGREGFYQWNGVDNRNQKAGVGYYLVLVEIFDLQGNQYKFKKKVVVGARF